MDMESLKRTYRFGVFELDPSSLELRRQGRLVAMAPQPAEVLTMLLEKPGQVVSREAIRQRLWGGDEPTHVDFDQGINTCIRQIRSALLDRASSPRFVETLPRRGYRFLAEVRTHPPMDSASPKPVPSTPTAARRRYLWGGIAAAMAVLLAAVLTTTIQSRVRSTAGAPTDGRVMLAVLPFANLSSDPEQEYFSDGLTEELISQLGQIEPAKLGVIARTSIVGFKNTQRPIAEIGAQLGVEYVLEGSVRRTAEEVRITAQLIRVDDQTHLWAESFERPLEDIFAIQREVASRVTGSLLSRLLPGLDSPATGVELTAYDHYLRGRYHFTRYDAVGYRSAIDSYRRALDIDPNFAAAWAGLGEAQVFLSWAGAPPEEVFPEAESAALRALELDPALPSAHNVLGIVRLYYRWDWPGAERAFARAQELDAGFAETYHWAAGLFSALGRHDEAIAHDLIAKRLDPISLTVRSDLCWYYNFARRWQDAIAACLQSLELEPYHGWSLAGLVLAHRRRGEHAAAWQVQSRQLEARRPDDLALLRAEGLDTDPAAAFERLDQLSLEQGLERFARGEIDSVNLATLLGRAGRLDEAIEHLDRAIDRRLAWVVFLDADPRFDPLREHPGFEGLRQRVGLPSG